MSCRFLEKSSVKCSAFPTARLPGWITSLVALSIAAISQLAPAQNPTITTINPSAVTVGGSAFALTVTGTNFNTTSTVSVNSFALVPSSQTATQLVATVPANLISIAGSIPVQVINRSAPGGPLPSNIVTLIVAPPAPPPALVSVSPGLPVR